MSRCRCACRRVRSGTVTKSWFSGGGHGRAGTGWWAGAQAVLMRLPKRACAVAHSNYGLWLYHFALEVCELLVRPANHGIFIINIFFIIVNNFTKKIIIFDVKYFFIQCFIMIICLLPFPLQKVIPRPELEGKWHRIKIWGLLVDSLDSNLLPDAFARLWHPCGVAWNAAPQQLWLSNLRRTSAYGMHSAWRDLG